MENEKLNSAVEDAFGIINATVSQSKNTTLEVQDASVSFCMTYEIPESSKEE